ncbi:MAG: hypothetical protein AAF191_05425 [Verrucomicrobiota bacterium]
MTSRAGVLLSVIGLTSLLAEHETVRGITLEAPPRPPESSAYRSLVEDAQADWVAIVPYAFLPQHSTQVLFDHPNQWWGERSEGITAQIRGAQEAGLRVFLKPQLWRSEGAYTGDLSFRSAKDWVAWEASYQTYILAMARLAEELQVEAFCVGNELDQAVRQRPNAFRRWIQNCRSIYSGKLTYASNWDCYRDPRFWSDLDAIGINAYFPLDPKDPAASWRKIGKEIGHFGTTKGKPIVFTEYGYRSIQDPFSRPWEGAGTQVFQAEGQQRALQALYQEIWEEPWFAGGFLWKWHLIPNRISDRGFTVQGKPALATVRKAYDDTSARKDRQ